MHVGGCADHENDAEEELLEVEYGRLCVEISWCSFCVGGGMCMYHDGLWIGDSLGSEVFSSSRLCLFV